MLCTDPSRLYRPEAVFSCKKELHAFRDYNCDDEDPIKKRVRLTYQKMHTFQVGCWFIWLCFAMVITELWAFTGINFCKSNSGFYFTN